MIEGPKHQPSPEEAKRKKREALERTKYTVNELLDLAEQNPKYKSLIVKTLVITVGVKQENRVKIEQWPDAVKSNGYVDVIATLNKKIQEEGIDKGIEILREFGDTEVTGLDFMLQLENITFSLWSIGREELLRASIGPDWHDQIINLLLQSKEESASKE